MLARDLINMPANYLTPQGLEDAARDLAANPSTRKLMLPLAISFRSATIQPFIP